MSCIDPRDYTDSRKTCAIYELHQSGMTVSEIAADGLKESDVRSHIVKIWNLDRMAQRTKELPSELQ